MSGIVREVVSILDKTPKTCALIDPDASLRKIFEDFLRDLGFVVTSFNDGSDFLGVFPKMRFDIIILDWFGETPGSKVVSAIKESGEPRPALFIMCPSDSSVSLDLAMPPFGFLFKPFVLDHMMKLFLKVLENDDA